MSDALYDGYIFVVLFRGEDGGRVRQMLRSATNPGSVRPVYVEQPQVTGLDFLTATGAVGDGLDSWWRTHVQATTMPVFLALDEDELDEWIRGSTGCWFVGVSDSDAESRLNSLSEPVFPVVTTDPEAVAEQAMLALGGRGDSISLFHPSFPYCQTPVRWPRAVPRLAPPPAEPVVVEGQPARLSPEDGGALHEARGDGYEPSIPPRPHQPIAYEVEPALAPETMPEGRAVAAGDAAVEVEVGVQAALSRVKGGTRRLRGMLSTVNRRPAAPAVRLGPMINANRPIVAAFASRKGGVGKTTHAAAVAATVGEALDGLPDTAALVDGNITNPDSWALNPPPGSATVRTLVSRLTQGQDPPPEQYARTPRLAIYPESRDSEELYTQADVDVFAEYLRRRHAFVAVDLPNALPSLTSGGPGAVAAAWLVHCDVVVLPFNADPRARQGLLEYVAVLADDQDLATRPILAPYIVSANRAISTDPAVQRDISELRRRGVEVTEIPDDENALLALLRDLPINQASERLRRAYLQMTETIIDMVLRSRRRI